MVYMIRTHNMQYRNPIHYPFSLGGSLPTMHQTNHEQSLPLLSAESSCNVNSVSSYCELPVALLLYCRDSEITEYLLLYFQSVLKITLKPPTQKDR